MALEDWAFPPRPLHPPAPNPHHEIAAPRPDRPFVSLPVNDDDLSEGYKEFTYSDSARVMDRCAWWIVSLLKRCERSEKRTLAYVGRQDVRYAVLMLGAVKEEMGGGEGVYGSCCPPARRKRSLMLEGKSA